jgi:hypothetical protein
MFIKAIEKFLILVLSINKTDKFLFEIIMKDILSNVLLTIENNNNMLDNVINNIVTQQ